MSKLLSLCPHAFLLYNVTDRIRCRDSRSTFHQGVPGISSVCVQEPETMKLQIGKISQVIHNKYHFMNECVNAESRYGIVNLDE